MDTAVLLGTSSLAELHDTQEVIALSLILEPQLIGVIDIMITHGPST